jgi:hypothetical protein
MSSNGTPQTPAKLASEPFRLARNDMYDLPEERVRQSQITDCTLIGQILTSILSNSVFVGSRFDCCAVQGEHK